MSLNLFIIFIAILNLVALQPSLAELSCIDFYNSRRLSEVIWSEEREKLQNSLQTSEASFFMLSAEPPRIVSVIEEISNSGTTHLGVYRVKTDSGAVLVLKISAINDNNISKTSIVNKSGSRVSVSAKFYNTFIIQNHLANLGLSPRIHGLIGKESIEKLYRKLKRVNKYLTRTQIAGDNIIGLLMDDMGDVWNGAGETPINFRVKSSLLNLKSKFSLVANALAELRIFIPDLQIFVSPEGRVYLADLDFAVYTGDLPSPAGHSELISEKAKYLLQKIEASPRYGYRIVDKRLRKNEYEQAVLKVINNNLQNERDYLRVASLLSKWGYKTRIQTDFSSYDIKRIINAF